MKIKRFEFNMFPENCYVLWDETNEAVVIDPGCFYEDNFIRNNRVADNRDGLSGRKNLPEILLGYHQYRGSDNEYSCCNLLWRMD